MDREVTLSGRQLLIAAAACVGVTALLAAFSCDAAAQVTGRTAGGRGAPVQAWPTYQSQYLPCLQTDPSCAAVGPRWVPSREEAEAVRALVVAYFRVQVAAGRLVQMQPTWADYWTIQPWDSIRPDIEFSDCFFSVPNATDGSGNSPTELCAAGMTDARQNRIVVSVAEKDRTLDLLGWEFGNSTVGAAHLCETPSQYTCQLADGPWVGKAVAFATAAMN